MSFSIAALALCAAAIVVRSASSRLSRELAVRDGMLWQQIDEHGCDGERPCSVSHFDNLTGLPNRRFFLERLEHVLADARTRAFDVAVIAVETGHRGDKVLTAIAMRLQQSLLHHDMVARSGGGEFLVLVPRLSWRDVEIVADTLRDAIAQPLKIDGYMLNVTAAIGISVFPNDGLDAESLAQQAGLATRVSSAR